MNFLSNPVPGQNHIEPKLLRRHFMEDIGSENEAHFWRESSIVLSKIEGVGYFENKRKHNEYLSNHPFVAKKLFINIKNYIMVPEASYNKCYLICS